MTLTPQEQVQALLAALEGRRSLIICTHNNPDPDALAAAVGLRLLVKHTRKIRSRVLYGGVIGRAENRTMIRQLRVGAESFRKGLLRPRAAVALVDTQPGARNSPLPADVVPTVVIDHHRPLRKRTRAVPYADVRPEYGSSSTILTEYLRTLEIPIPARVATALLYGVQTDTMGLGRSGLDQDIEAMQFLYPLSSLRLLHRIRNPRLPRATYQVFAEAVARAHTVRDVLISHLGPTPDADVIAQMADFLIRAEGLRWVLVTGAHAGGLHFSLRTSSPGKRAGLLAYRVAGRRGAAGGHDRSAGGRLELTGTTPEEAESLARDLEQRLLLSLKRSGDPHAFVAEPPPPSPREPDPV